ncbi:MAG: hypothetical protein ACFBSF_11795 [Leptolyngbyaceae cyanobacterium]
MDLSKGMQLARRLSPSVRYSFGNNMEKKVFFLHVHKCGGTSILNSIAATYGFSNNIARRRFGDLSNEASVKAANLVGSTPEDFRENILLYYMSLPDMRYIYGHFSYSERAMKEYGSDWNFITVLRDPISRWFSHYFMDRYKEERSFYASIDEELGDFLHSERSLWEARKYVLMFTDDITLEEASSQAAIDQAIENLKKFSIVGFLDRLNDFSIEFESRLGTYLRIPKLNKSPISKVEQKKLVTPAIRKKVEAICEPSTQVYQAIRALK